MESGYKTKVMKPAKTKAVSHADGTIFEEDGLFKFNWKGGVCGYASKEDAEKGLEKVSGKSNSEDNS